MEPGCTKLGTSVVGPDGVSSLPHAIALPQAMVKQSCGNNR